MQFNADQSSQVTFNPSRRERLLIFTIMMILLMLGLNHFVLSERSAHDLLSDASPKYKIKFTEDVKILDEIEKNSQVVYMTFESELHRCHVPVRKNNTETESQTESMQVKKERVKQEVLQTIFPKFNQACYFRVAGWWIYEFCFNKHVRQFHQEQQAVTTEFFLGHSKEHPDSKNDPKIIKHFDVHFNDIHPEESYVSIPFDKGTPCDLTRQPRTVEVRMYCATDLKRRQLTNTIAHDVHAHFIGDIEEPSTCTYSLKFYSNHLCKLDGFSPKQETESDTIYCIPETAINDEEKDVSLFETMTQDILEDEQDESTNMESPTESNPTTTTTTSTTQDQSLPTETEIAVSA
ncbi:hypothetical protein C9374_005170 [Naegleria lovaniensis]|uniref:MRH domain-containing protein n=1 Tax=Naegleria lovaniensis TaxID=51637 RepID=A0AA88GR70_NAELO|nr:uncharacterized protein C9374_005170 [Naegleria lovaniensis]KAG2382590.1 hypothetical protein C9374_005170 [Naegleria lovaniensis]